MRRVLSIMAEEKAHGITSTINQHLQLEGDDKA